MLPNALVVAFDSRVRFEASGDPRPTASSVGRLVIPVDEGAGRAREARLDRRRPAALGRDPRRGRRALPGLRHGVHHRQRRRAALAVHPGQLDEAAAEGPDPRTAARRRPSRTCRCCCSSGAIPALLLDRLNYDPDSPLHRRIRTPTTAEGTIKDNSILKMLAMSIEDGALYQWFDPESGERRHRGDARPAQELLARRRARRSRTPGTSRRGDHDSCTASGSSALGA